MTSRPRRIHVTGNAGAGKTTLAARLGEHTGLPVFSLDRIVWRPGWRKTPPAERAALEEALIARPEWIVEGVSARVRAAADLVIFLDLPRAACVRRALVRTLRNRGRARPGLPADCPDWRIVPRLIGLIRRFPAAAGDRIRAEAAADPGRFVIVRNQAVRTSTS